MDHYFLDIQYVDFLQLTHLFYFLSATLQSICYGTRHILDTLADAGHDIHTVSICGGLAKSNILLHAMVIMKANVVFYIKVK